MSGIPVQAGFDPGLDPVWIWALRLFLAGLFARTAVAKLRAPRAFAEAIRGYAIVPERAVGFAAAGLLAAELGTAIALLLPGAAPTAAVIALVLLLAYTAAIALNLARGRRDIDCGCAGPLQRTPLHEWLLVRNAVYGLAAGAAAFSAVTHAARDFGWLDAATLILGVGALTVLSLAADELAAVAARADALVAAAGGARP